MVDKILKKNNFYKVDKEEFYSLADEIFVNTLFDYDDNQPFRAFLYSCLDKKIKTYMTRTNRHKRKNYIKVEKRDDNGEIVRDENGNIVYEKRIVPDESIYQPIGDDENSTLGDMIASNISIEKELFGDDKDIIMDEKIERYLKSLSNIQRKIIELKMQNVEIHIIKKQLGLTDKQYSNHMQEAIQYEHIRLLHI